MNLDKLQVNACIRSGWQALDLGLLMARAWWRPLFVASLLPMLPLTVVLLAVFHESPLWAWFVLWWLKPFWERLPLFIASRLLFGESPGIWTSMRSLSLKDSLPWLLWRRFSLQRAFDNPVTVLEELKGSARRQRLRVLHGKYSDVAVSNQLFGYCCEWLLTIGLLILFDFFVPDSLDIRLFDSFNEMTLGGAWILSIAGILAMALVMPFHCMAGFALYLNRRIELEAWDIEISFRNLASRRQAPATRAAAGPVVLLSAALVFTTLCATLMPTGAEAASNHDRDSASALIENVLNGDDYGTERNVRKWRFKDWGEDLEAEAFPEWIIDVIEWLEASDGWWQALAGIAFWFKILLVLLLGGVVIYLLRRYRGPLSRLRHRAAREAAPEVLFGLDVTPESLPEDVPSQVMLLWEQGAGREALSLLYRATLSRLIDRHQIAFRASHTEAECAGLVRACGVEPLGDYFWRLTQVWRRLAYGHRLPLAETVRELCAEWNRRLADDAQ
jgi:hypothetical protein